MPKPFLRYAGGKSRHTSKILKYLHGVEEYREPFIGGGSVYLASRFSSNWINDVDTLIYDCWRMVQEEPEHLIELFRNDSNLLSHNGDPAKIKEAMQYWRDMSEGIVDIPDGYRALFLNKTCFSGVLDAGPTGGLEQTGKYNLKSRWAEASTVRAITAAHKKLHGCRITNYDFEEVVAQPGRNVGLYCDPPYLMKGKQCYRYAFDLDDHRRLAKSVIDSGHRFVVTVDDEVELRQIWSALGVPDECFIEEQWTYSMSDYRKNNRTGKELFVVDEVSRQMAKKKKHLQSYE